MPLPTDRTTANTPAEHVADHNTIHDAINDLSGAYPLGTLGYAQIVADQGGITTEVDLTGLSAAVTVGTSRRIRISFQCLIAHNVASDMSRVSIKEGATLLTLAQSSLPDTNANFLCGSVVLTPSAGAHTYKLTAKRDSGSGITTVSADAAFPAYILVEDIGAA